MGAPITYRGPKYDKMVGRKHAHLQEDEVANARGPVGPGFEAIDDITIPTGRAPVGPNPAGTQLVVHQTGDLQGQPMANILGTMGLKDITCPICGREQKVHNTKLLSKSGFFCR